MINNFIYIIFPKRSIIIFLIKLVPSFIYRHKTAGIISYLDFSGDNELAKYVYRQFLKNDIPVVAKSLFTLARLAYKLDSRPGEVQAKYFNDVAQYSFEKFSNSRKIKLEDIWYFIKIFRPDLALQLFQEKGSTLKLKEQCLAQRMVERVTENLNSFNINIPETWNDSFTSDHEEEVIFHIPAAFRKIPFETNRDIYNQIIEFTISLNNTLEVQPSEIKHIFQFNWKNTLAFPDDKIVFSYHTKGKTGKHIRFKESAFSSYFSLDNLGYSGWHTVSTLSKEFILKEVSNISQNTFDDFHQKIYQNFALKNVSKYKQDETSDNKIPFKDFIFFPMQVETDAVSCLASIKTFDLCILLADICIKHNLNLVIKRHPLCESKRIEKLIKTLNRKPNIFLSSASIHSLVKDSRFVVTVNSGVGMEALVHLKNIISTGKSDYLPATTFCQTPTELEKAILNTTATQNEFAKPFIYYFFNFHLYQKDFSEEQKSKINQKVKSFWLNHKVSSENKVSKHIH